MDDHIIDMDLSRIARLERRAAWRRWSAEIFANIQVIDLHGGPLEGYIRGVRLGAGRLVRIYSAGQRIQRRQLTPEEAAVTVLMQLAGITSIERQQHSYQLTPGDICVVDGSTDFDQRLSLASEVIMLQMPRSLALAQRPTLVLTPITVYPGELPAARLLRRSLEAAHEVAAELSRSQRERLRDCLFDLAALLSETQDDGLGHDQKRRREALVAIEESLAEPGLNASGIAERVGLSRRRLDEIFVQHVGRSVAAYIRERRLARARDLLRDARHAGRMITEIAFEVGFEDSSHFSRAFKARYGMTPKAWRRNDRQGK